MKGWITVTQLVGNGKFRKARVQVSKIVSYRVKETPEEIDILIEESEK